MSCIAMHGRVQALCVMTTVAECSWGMSSTWHGMPWSKHEHARHAPSPRRQLHLLNTSSLSPQCGRSAARQAPFGSTPTMRPWRQETRG